MKLPLKKNTFSRLDNMDPRRGLPAFHDKSVDCIFTDPPYSEYVHRIGLPGQYKPGAEKVEQEALSFDAITLEQIDLYAKQFVRVCKGWILIFCALEDIASWKIALEKHGAKRRNTIIWTKSQAAPKMQGDGPANAAEAIVTAWAGRGKSVWNAGGSLGWYHYPVELDKDERVHPTQKPVPLCRQVILDFTMPPDRKEKRPAHLILDPFAGGGAHLRACKELERDFIGMELADDEVTLKAYERGLVKLNETRVQTHMQQLMLHKRRRASAYAGVKVIPIAVQTGWNFDDPKQLKKRGAKVEVRDHVPAKKKFKKKPAKAG